MKNAFPLILFILITNIFCGCSSKATFTEKELRWLTPFKKTDTINFVSENGLKDTIVFYGIDTSVYSSRNLEQGFRDEKTIKVAYKLTDNSYHKFLDFDTKTKIVDFITLTDNDNWTKPEIEIYFLGSVYNNSFIDKQKKVSSQIIHFDEKNAVYKDVNIVEGIKSFDYDFEKGVIKFVDKFDRVWTQHK